MTRPLFLLAILAAACAKSTPAKPADIQQHVQLQRAASCQSLTRTVQDTAVRQMRAQLDQEKDSYGPVMAAGGATPAPPAPATSGAAPASYTTTNTQVAGVDEADFVKNDGTRIFVLSGQTLFAATSWPPQDLALAGKLQIEGWPQSMFLDGDRVVVFSTLWSSMPSGMMCPLGALCPVSGATTTKITVVGVADLKGPVVQSEVYLPGWSAGARRVGSSVRLVLSDSVRWPEKIEWWPDYSPGLYQDKAKLIDAIDALEDQNEAVIRSTPIEAWFPHGQRKLSDGTLVDVAYQCSDFYLSNAPERLGLVTIATLDLDHLDAGVSRSSLVAESGVIYATAEHLYVASPHWWWWTLAGQHEYTYVHEFDLTDPAKAGYLASGGVDGIVDDQFAMDEKDGYLRIATSTETWIEDSPHMFHTQVSSQLNVLGPKGDATLAVVGGIDPLQDGERLMATRFTGAKGYAVTFRNIDPLVTLDLSDPAHPKKVAELTLPGFSTYLQPIDSTHLLAIGEDVPLDGSGHPDWSHRALELSLFDVSDLAHPLRTAQQLVGTAWAYSEALWDHHAFNWYQPDPSNPGLLAIPFSDWVQGAPSWWDGFVSDVRVFSVDPSGSITAAGSLAMSDVYIQEGSGQWTWWYRPWVQRSVMSTDTSGRTFVYAVSDAGLRSAALDTLTSPLATALFPRN